MMLYVATGKKQYLFLGIVFLVVASVAGYYLFSHVQTRVIAWINPLSVIDDKGYQICKSLFAIGTGGWFGLGLNQGLPNTIPVVEQDFICHCGGTGGRIRIMYFSGMCQLLLYDY